MISIEIHIFTGTTTRIQTRKRIFVSRCKRYNEQYIFESLHILSINANPQSVNKRHKTSQKEIKHLRYTTDKNFSCFAQLQGRVAKLLTNNTQDLIISNE